MAAAQFFGVGNVARKVKGQYIGVGGVARKVKAGYIGVGGVARKFYAGEKQVVKSGIDSANAVSGMNVAFDSVVPAFTKAVVTVNMPPKSRFVYVNGVNSSRTLTVPYWEDDPDEVENPVYFYLTSSDGESASGRYDYDFFYSDSEAQFDTVSLMAEVTRSGLKLWFDIYFYDPDDDDYRHGTASLDLNSWRVTFTCEGD